MSSAFRRGSGRLVLALVVGGGLASASCGSESPPSKADAEPRTEPRDGTAARPDARLITHAFEPSTPTPAGLAYVEFVADVHERADLADDPTTRAEILEDGLERRAPAALPEAEVLRLELGARLGELLLELDDADEAAKLLGRLVPPDRSLPLDRASAHALTVLGDAAQRRGDDALAAGSYARAVRMMSLLADDLAERAGVPDSTEGGTP